MSNVDNRPRRKATAPESDRSIAFSIAGWTSVGLMWLTFGPLQKTLMPPDANEWSGGRTVVTSMAIVGSWSIPGVLAMYLTREDSE